MTVFYTIFFFLLTGYAYAQEPIRLPGAREQQFESLSENTDTEPEDDSYLQLLEQYRNHPLNLNNISEQELSELKILQDLQVKNFFSYRKLLGNLISIYELQAVPGWDIKTINQLLPYITVSDQQTITENLKQRWKGGDHSLLLRTGTLLEKSKGYSAIPNAGAAYYQGSRLQLMARYKYNYKNLLQWGLLGDKDAGESFFSGAQKKGFDFYSFHFFARNLGIVKNIALGDFTVSMGQGLIQWQGFGFRKSSEVIAVKRNASVLSPYNSAGEFNFHRGAGVTLSKNNCELTIFGSLRKLSGNINIDSLHYEEYVSSFLTSGYHRTAAEIDNRNSLELSTLGTSVKYRVAAWHLSLNAIYYNFSKKILKQDELYNLFSLQGKNWMNASVDYSYTWKNIHFFGEAALDKNAGKAFLNGLLISLDGRVDASILYRRIDKNYQSIFAGAFTENTLPNNESGFYAGISITPISSVKVAAYADLYNFPWLKYLVDAPSFGKDYLLQVTYTPKRSVEIYMRFRRELKRRDYQNSGFPTKPLIWVPRTNCRLNVDMSLNSNVLVGYRLELIWFDDKGPLKEQGYLSYADYILKPAGKRWNAGVRLQYFETTGYNSRLYAFENDVLYAFSIPAFYDKGFRYYVNLKYDLKQILKRYSHSQKLNIQTWFRWSQTLYPGKSSVGANLDEIAGSRKSAARLQLLIFF